MVLSDKAAAILDPALVLQLWQVQGEGLCLVKGR